MWADPARFSAEEVAERQTSGERGLDRWLDDGRLTVDVPELRECAVVLVEPNQGRFVR
jgi:hypothetical protein